MEQMANWLRYSPGWLRVLCFLLLLAIAWLPWVGMVHIGQQYGAVADENQANIIRLIGLYGLFVGGLPQWGRRLHGYEAIWARYGFAGPPGQWLRELSLGIALGGLSLASLFGIETLLGWLSWQGAQLPWAQLLLDALLVGVGIGLAEELLFRGWLLDELERSYPPRLALLVTTVIYAATHGLRWQFWALCLLGIALGLAKWIGTVRSRAEAAQTRSRLGLATGLHGGLVGGYYLVNVGKLGIYTGRGPTWMTGLDNNPLAGFLGVGLMALLTLGLGFYYQRLRRDGCFPAQ
jgi:uncharacterized protein